MRPSFKIKSKSLPFFRQRLYDKISKKFKQQKWEQFLERELQLTLAIRELSKAEFDISNQNQHKYSVRQNFQIKKDIIRCLEEEDIQSSLLKLEKLKVKMKEFNQEKGVSAMITFLECSKLIKAEIKNGKEELIIARIKAKLGDTIFDNESFMVKIKTMSILSILLLRFHGILMTAQQRTIIFKTIDLKKRRMLHIDEKEDRQAVFQCLIYILSQLYKIIYLLKLDQQTLLRYYNQLHAYSQIFMQKRHSKTLIQIQELLKILSDMKPSINDLNIYEDSKIKRQLAFQHIIEEIVEKDEKPEKKIYVDPRLSTSSFRKSLEMSIHSSGKFGTSGKLNIDNNPRKLTLKRPTFQKLSHLSSKKDQHEIINILTTKGIHYTVLLPILQKFYMISLTFSFRNGFGLLDFDLTLSTQFTLIQKYQLKGICNALQKMTVDGIGKMLQKICLRVFGSTAQFSQIHNLIIDERYVPGQYEPLIFGLIRAKAVIKQYMRNHIQQEYITSKKIIYPRITIAELNTYLAGEFTDEEGKRLRNTFEKRKGMFHRDEPLAKLPQMLFLKFLVKKQADKRCQYFFFNAYFAECFKGLDVFCLRSQSQPPDLSAFIQKMKQISKKAYEKHALIHRPKAIGQLLLQQSRQAQYLQEIIIYRVDQQLQLPTTNLKHEAVSIKAYNPLKRKPYKKKDQRTFEVIRTRKNQFAVFLKQNHNDYVRYSNGKHILNIPQQMLGQELRIEKKRVRMYNTISIGRIGQTGTNSIKASIKKGVVIASKQVLALKFCRHLIVKKNQGFMMVIEYLCPSEEYLYELVLSPIARYYAFLKQKMDGLNWNEIDWLNLKLKDCPLHQYKGGRKEISEANYFYSCTKQLFPRTKSEVRQLQQLQEIS